MSEPTPPVWNASAAGGPDPEPAVAPGTTSPPPPPAVTRPPSARKVSGGVLAVGLSALVAVGGLAFAIGRVTAPAATTVVRGQLPGSGQLPSGSFVPGGMIRGALGGITISGTVTAVGDGELTIETSSGTELTIPVDDTTAYHAQADASADDIDDGTEVQIQVEPGGGRGPAASPGAGALEPGQGGLSFGTATDVTIVGD